MKIHRRKVRAIDTTYILGGPGQLWRGGAEEDKYPELDPEAPL